MSLMKTGALNGIAVAIKMTTLLVINKVLAIYVGPSGYAALGQFQNAMQMITTFASGAINTGVTKYTAEYHDDQGRQNAVWRTAGSVCVIGSVVSGVLICLLNEELAKLFLHDRQFGIVFIWFGCTLVLFTMNSLLLAVLNGRKEIGVYVLANIVGSLLALGMTTVMAVCYGLVGALIALATYQAVAFLATLLICMRRPWFAIGLFFGRTDFSVLKNLLKFTVMAFTAAVCMPTVQIMIRNEIGREFGWEYSGYWEAMLRLSTAYLMFVTTTLSVYYLPRLSELLSFDDIKLELRQAYKIIIPFTALCGISIYLFRDLIITILFTDKFLPMRELFALQMIGDCLKICTWLLSYVLLSKAMYKEFVIIEISFAVFYYFAAIILMKMIGIEGSIVAYVLSYGVFFPLSWLFIRSGMRRINGNAVTGTLV